MPYMNTNKKHTAIQNTTKLPYQRVTVEDVEKIRNMQFSQPKKYVVAGNYAEYIAYIKRKGYPAREYVYVHDISTIMGISSISGVFIGTWRNRPDIDSIQHQISMVKLQQKVMEDAAEQIQKQINGGIIAQTIATNPDPRVMAAMNDTSVAIDQLMNTMWLENKSKENT
jgi:hypothetical protein